MFYGLSSRASGMAKTLHAQSMSQNVLQCADAFLQVFRGTSADKLMWERIPGKQKVWKPLKQKIGQVGLQSPFQVIWFCDVSPHHSLKSPEDNLKQGCLLSQAHFPIVLTRLTWWPRQVPGTDRRRFQRAGTKELQNYWCLWSTQTSTSWCSQRSARSLGDLIKEVLQANLPPSRLCESLLSPGLCSSREETQFWSWKLLCSEWREMTRGSLVKSNAYQVYTGR